LPDGDGLRLHEDLRNAGLQAPFLLLCGSDTTDAERERIRAAQPDAVLSKPVADKVLLAAVGEFLIVRGKDLGGGGAAVFSTLSPRDPLAPHVPEFVRELRLLGDRLGQALAAGDAAECRRIATQIRGSAPTFGFGATAEAAKQAINTLQTAPNLGEAAAAIRRLVASCRRAQVKRAAA
jgi:CheY-like chemotaxis protein